MFFYACLASIYFYFLIEHKQAFKVVLLGPDSIGTAFTFDFRNPSRIKRPFQMSLVKSGRSAETSPVECNGSKVVELQLRLQSQQEEMRRMQEEQNHLQEELSSQKVQDRDRRMGKSRDLETLHNNLMQYK